jgi:hypothetical protein
MKWSWTCLRYHPGICVEELRKTTKNLSQDTRSPGRDLNPGLPAYEAVLVITRPRRSVRVVLKILALRSANEGIPLSFITIFKRTRLLDQF